MRAIYLLWRQAADSYGEPEEFQTYLNSCIQELRNITFVLQKGKSKVAGFDAWYEPWQKKMRADPVLRWVIEARNKVVKMGDLETTSSAHVAVADSFDERPIASFDVPPSTTSEEILDQIPKMHPQGPSLTHGYISVERKWVDPALPDWELLDAMSHAYQVYGNLIHALHIHASKTDDANAGSPGGEATDFGDHRPLDMRSTAPFRTSYKRFVDGQYSTVRRHVVTPEEVLQATAGHDPYNYDPSEDPSTGFKFLDLAEGVLRRAMHIRSCGDEARPFAFFVDASGSMTLAGVQYTDKTDKYMIANFLADEARNAGATGIIMVAEAWYTPVSGEGPFPAPAQSPDRLECIVVSGFSLEGHNFNWVVPFTQGPEGPVFSPRLEGGRSFYMDPIIKAIKNAHPDEKTDPVDI